MLLRISCAVKKTRLADSRTVVLETPRFIGGATMAGENKPKTKQYRWPRRKFEEFLAPADDGSKGSLFWLFAIALAFVLVIFGYALIAQPGADGGVFGDLVGGTLNPVLTFLTFMALLITIVLQQTELRATKEELAKSADALEAQIGALEIQAYEATFFQTLARLDSIVNTLKVSGGAQSHEGRAVFGAIIGHLKNLYSDEKGSEQEKTQRAFSEYWKKYRPNLSNYMRFLLATLRFIDEQGGDSKKYMRLIRASLSDLELINLFYYSVSTERKPLYLRRIIETYSLFEDMPVGLMLSPIHKVFYDKQAFHDAVDDSRTDIDTLVAMNDIVTMAPRVGRILINAKGNDYSLDSEPFDITRIVSVSAGEVAIENGQVSYKKPDKLASVQTIVYEISNAHGATSQATITINVHADEEAVKAV